MYEIGRVYIWQNQVVISSHINGVECVPHEPASTYRNMLTNQVVWGQLVINCDGGRWIAVRGDLRPKNPPAGEKSITDLFKAPEHEPA